MDVRLPNGTIIRGIPEGTSKEEVRQKAISAGLATEQDFAIQPTPTPTPAPSPVQESIDGLEQFQQQYQPQITPEGIPEDVPTDISLQMQPTPPPAPEYTLPQMAAGGLETALSTVTGAIGAPIGMGIGFIEGVIQAGREGKLGTDEGADIIEKASLDRGEKLTFQPKTEAGRAYLRELGETLAPLQALGPGVGVARAKVPPKKATAPDVPDVPATQVTSQVEPPKPLADADLAAVAKRASGTGPLAARAKNILAEQASPDMGTVAAAQRLGVEEYLQPDQVTTSQQYRNIAQVIKSAPGSKARQLELEGRAAIAQRADELITEIGGSDDWSTLRGDVKRELENVQKAYDDRSDYLWKKKINPAIPQKERVNTTNTLNYLENEIDEMNGYKNLSPAQQKVYDRLSPKNGQLPTYALLDKTRKELTEARVKNKGVFKDSSATEIKILERQLLDDQRNVAEQFGVRDLFDEARATTAARKSVEDDMISLFGRQLDGSFITPLQTGIKDIAKGDVTKFKRTIDKIPEEMRPRVVATALETALGKNARQGQMNFNSYANWYENALRNKEAYNALMENLPSEARKTMRDLYMVSNGIRKAAKEYIPTGRGESLRESLMAADGLLKNIMSQAGTGAVSAGLEALVPGGGIVMAIKSGLAKKKPKGLTAVDDLMASPEFRNLVNERVKTGNTKQSTLNRLTKSAKFKKYIQSVGKLGVAPELWLLNAMRPESEESI